MGKASKRRGAGHTPVVSGQCSFLGVELAANGSRTGGLSATVVGTSVPPGSTRLWGSINGQGFQPLDRYETYILDVEATPVLDALLGGGDTVEYYCQYRDASGELVCQSDTLFTVFPSD